MKALEQFILGPNKDMVDRQCLISREIKPVSQLIRFVRGPNDDVVPDLKRVLPGRGVWVTANKSALIGAVRKNVFVRGFNSRVFVDSDLPDRVEKLLERQVLGSLGIACKAGMVVTGYSKVASVIRSGNIKVVIHSQDASEEGLRKLKGMILARFGNLEEVQIIEFLSIRQISEILGKSNVVNAALLQGQASASFLDRVFTLERFREENLQFAA